LVYTGRRLGLQQYGQRHNGRLHPDANLYTNTNEYAHRDANADRIAYRFSDAHHHSANYCSSTRSAAHSCATDFGTLDLLYGQQAHDH
jgi:hypothetical protein